MMTNCQNIKNDLSALIDGELSAERQAAVVEHVDRCPACGRRIAELQRLATGLGALPKLEVPTDFLAGVQRRLRPVKPLVQRDWADRLFRPFWLKIPLETLAVVTVLVAVLWWLPAERPTPVVALAAKPTAQPRHGMTARILSTELAKPPAAHPADLQLAGREFQTKSFAATAGGAADGKLVDDLRAQPLPPVIVRGESLVAVRMRVTDLTTALNCQIQAVTPSNTFVVHLPTRNVSAFRTAMTHPRKVEPAYALSAASPMPAGERSAAGSRRDGKAPSEPVVELEVIVEPAGP